MSSAVSSAVKYVQNKISNIAAGQFNSYDSFDAKTQSCSLTLPNSGNHKDSKKSNFKI